MIEIEPLKQTRSCYKMLRFKFNGKIMGCGDTLVINDVKSTEYLKIMVHENGNIEVWTEDVEGNETNINWEKKE